MVWFLVTFPTSTLERIVSKIALTELLFSFFSLKKRFDSLQIRFFCWNLNCVKLLSQWWHFSFGNGSQFYNKIVSNFCRVIFWVISFLVSLKRKIFFFFLGERVRKLACYFLMRWDEGEISVFSFSFLFCILSDFRYTHYSSPISVLLFGRLGYLPTMYSNNWTEN